MKLTSKLAVLFLLLSISPLAVVGYLAYDDGRGNAAHWIGAGAKGTRDRDRDSGWGMGAVDGVG